MKGVTRMADREKSRRDYFNKMKAHLVGAKVVAVEMDEDDGAMPAIVFDNGVVGFLQSDPEGNGVGALMLMENKPNGKTLGCLCWE
jgi:hypothetical protein